MSGTETDTRSVLRMTRRDMAFIKKWTHKIDWESGDIYFAPG